MITTVLLVDDHAILLSGLGLLLEKEPNMKVVGEAGDGQTAIDLVRDLAPDVVVMDISLPDMNGIEATHQILVEHPDTRVLALSIHSEKRFVDAMLAAGATGYMLKESMPEELIDAIQAVQRGEVYLSPAITEVVVAGYKETLSEKHTITEKTLKDSSGPLLATKLSRPPISSDLVLRQHLLERLERNPQRPLTLISAPAGYGKSVLASQWLHASNYPGTWVSLDKNDNDLRTFISYLLSAVRSAFPSIELKTQALIEAPNLPPVHTLARDLLNDLDQIKMGLILVLDDIHLIHEQEIFELLGEMLQHPPPCLHLVLISRQDPPLPISTLRARQQITEIRQQDLRFTVPETRLLLESLLGREIQELTAENWTANTEGWVTALQLAALSLQHRALDDDNLAAYQGDNQYLQEYLLAEVLSHLPSARQAMLLKLTILDRFNAPLCEALCQHDLDHQEPALDGTKLLYWLQAANLFVIPLDERGEWFRFHHLFQQLARNWLTRQTTPDEVAALHAAACAWFAENNLIDEAIQHALAAGDTVRAAQIVEQNESTILNQDKWYVLEKWLSYLPDSIKQQRLSLLLAQAWVVFKRVRYAKLLSILDLAESKLSGDPSEDVFVGKIAFFRGFFFCFQGQGQQSLAYLEDALERIPREYYSYRGEAEDVFGVACHMVFGKEKAIHQLNHWINAQPPPNDYRLTRLLASLIYSQLLSGDLAEAADLNQRLRMVAIQMKNAFAIAYAAYLQGFIHFFQHELDPALTFFREAAEKRHILFARTSLDAQVGLALTLQARGQTDQANEALKMLFEYAQSQNDPKALEIARSSQARLGLMQGELAPALDWLESSPTPAQEVMLWWIENPVITYCRVLIFEGSAASLRIAEDKLQESLQANQEHHNLLHMIQILALLSLVYRKQARRKDALEYLERGLTLAEPGRIIFPLIEMGPLMADLLTQLQRQPNAPQSPTSAYIAEILAAFPTADQAIPSGELSSNGSADLPTQTGLSEPLTKRELQTLKYLATQLSTDEIAEEMVVSVDTVRSHTKNIYSKLNVHSRFEAVQQAKDWELI